MFFDSSVCCKLSQDVLFFYLYVCMCSEVLWRLPGLQVASLTSTDWATKEKLVCVVCVHVRVCACAHACVYVCACVCVA